MKKLIYSALGAMSLILGSCSEDVINQPNLNIESKSYIGKANSHKVSEQDAVNTILSYFKSLQPDAVSRSASPDSIPDINDVTVITKDDLNIWRDSIYNSSDIREENYYDDTDKAETEVYIDTLFYVVNFANNGGFAILPADDRTDPIYAIIDEGNFHVDSLQNEQNTGFLGFLDESVYTLLQDASGQQNNPRNWQTNPGDLPIDDGGGSGFTHTKERIEPMLKTRWGQMEPFNKYCPGPYAGCTVIAVSQILSYYKTISSVSWS